MKALERLNDRAGKMDIVVVAWAVVYGEYDA
jgi:hypothetical protein